MIELINKLKNRIFMLVAEGIMQSVTSTQGQHLKAKLSLLADEVKEDYDILQDYGFSSIIPKNSSVVALCIGGSRDNGIVIASDSKQYKPSLADGEVAIYTKFGQKIHLDSNGDVNIFCDDTIASFKVLNRQCLQISSVYGLTNKTPCSPLPILYLVSLGLNFKCL